MRARPAYAVTLGAEAIAASTPYVLVDLSDITNFPHGNTAEIHLLGLILTTEKASDGAFDIWLGVVTENDATDGSVTWVHCFHVEHVFNATDDDDRYAREIDFTLGGSIPEGINLNVTSGALTKFASNLTQADNASWQNDVNRTSPVGATTKPGVGDLVMWVEETADGGTLDFCITAIYSTA